MGSVWRARDEALGRQVAVKCLQPLAPQNDPSVTRVLRERFRREARAAAGLQHRGVTVVHDFGESDGLLYLVMELLEGRSLSQLLRDNGNRPLPVAEVADIATQVAQALAYTHQQGIVHRDLKPANIFRVTDGTVKICDFGIARLERDIGLSTRLTATGIALGTPHYMSPEQISGSAVDQRSDLYSLGCVLYEIATGAPPFDLDDTWAILFSHQDTPPRPPRSQRADLPEHLERIILDLLAKRPEQRPNDAAEVARRLGAAGPAAPPPLVAARGTAVTVGRESAGLPLPVWARGMAAGPRAVSAGTLTLTQDAAVGLIAAWTERPATGGVREPPSQASPAPSPRALAALARRHDIGRGLGRLGRWSDAGEVHRSVAAERERLLGPDHPDTLASRYEVALALSRTGRAADALREYKGVARARSRTLGPDHPDTLAVRQEMAYVLGQLGRHFDAHRVYVSVLTARERVMGADHPDTLRCRHNLAFNLSRLGRLEDSYRMAAEVAAARARVLGADHPDTLLTRYEVAYALGGLGRWEEALETYREVADARSRALGPDAPDTLAARYETGIALGRLGRAEEALRLYRDLVGDRTRVQGPTHPETLRARHSLGVSLGRLGRWEEALAEAREVCALRGQALGPEHPDTLVSRREVAVALGWLGRWAEALTEYHGVAAARARVLGADHPDTVASYHDEAHCLEQLGRGAEATQLYRRVAALRQRRSSHT
ncbi:tetratricopeptide repeat protein [Streptomyces sp. G45]|uniref:serine/threonine-protein kinase n=1 Tax=Streptomyces sp. G45 TaxID=3406627 RepID=UPI003C22D7BD